ncbi:RAMP superfamily CRISPR-associated protein [Colwellia sp. 12G3]|uniref:RAMP superfamily CRISPR-associated protein n=1 Tax=Colwellia sp. 12G3 TaxID=2058299 RepID=UPI0018E347F4|nr:RAMP superfamily CRISPR-associated protein [Colwellia sp. 12G3]
MGKVYLTRLIIETQSPMAINTGNREVGFDSQLARDANNLPYVPATSIAGVWKHLAKEVLSENSIDNWFGYTGKESQSSTLTISDGVLHNSKNKPVQGLLTPEAINQDSLLSMLVQARPHHRERVSINDRGVAKNTGKFDQILLPAGIRFCIDIKFYDDRLANDTISKEWDDLLNCWQNPLFALGANTRNGLGKLTVVASNTEVINLSDVISASHKMQSHALRENIPEKNNINFIAEQNVFATLPLKALDNWRSGAGSQLLGKYNKGEADKSIAMITYSEPKVKWHSKAGKTQAEISEPKAVLCGSSIKGILAHRITFHWRRHEALLGKTGMWAEEMEHASHEQWETRPEGLKYLLGFADQNDHENSLAGSLYVDDSDISFVDTTIRHHNSIDRFTGGVRKGALYSEELLYQPEFTLTLNIKKGTVLSHSLKQALSDTLDDLKIGLLPMGAGSGRGTSIVMANPEKSWLVNLDHIKTESILAVTEETQGASS